MTFLESLVLGIIQGITEWLPISSEGISSLVMVQFFNKTLSEAVFYSLWLHLGTLLAAVFYFWPDVKKIVKGIPNYVKQPTKKEHKLTHFLVISTICTVLIGAPLLYFGLQQMSISGTGAVAIIGIFLIITGVTQLCVKKKKALQQQPTTFMALIVGLVQGFAALPGLSRSGLTTATLLFGKYDTKQALRLSFLMSIPIVLAAQVGLSLLNQFSFDMYAFFSLIVAFLAGLVTLKLFLGLAEKINFGWFCILLGLVSFIQLLF